MIENPITLRDHIIPSFKTTRQEFINDKNRKYGGTTKFNFSKYKTDKERLEEHFKQKVENQNQLNRIKKEEEEKFEKRKKIDNNRFHSIEQPAMRYKARTDLERIYDSVNEYSYGKISKNFINEHLNKLNLINVKKKEGEDEKRNPKRLDNYKYLEEHEINELQSHKEFLNSQGFDERNSETVKEIETILTLNQEKLSEAGNFIPRHEADENNRHRNRFAIKSQFNSGPIKKLLREDNSKTFFKAASTFCFKSFELEKKNNDQRFKKNSIDNYNISKDKAFNNFEKNSNDNDYLHINSSYGNKHNKIKSYDISNNNFNSNNNQATTFSNFQRSIKCSNKAEELKKKNIFLSFIKSDEPYNDEIEMKNSIENNPVYTNYQNFFFKSNSNSKENNKQKFQISLNKGNTRNLFSPITIDTKINFNSFDNSFKETNPITSSIDMNYIINKKEVEENHEYDPKSLVYLKNISQSNSLLNDKRKSEEDAKHQKNQKFRSSKRKKCVQIKLKDSLFNYNENLSKADYSKNDSEHSKKSNLNYNYLTISLFSKFLIL